MFTAKEAKAMSKTTTHELQAAEILKIENAVKNAAAAGRTSATVQGWIYAANQEQLEALGYKVNKVDDFRDGNYTQISWHEIK